MMKARANGDTHSCPPRMRVEQPEAESSLRVLTPPARTPELGVAAGGRISIKMLAGGRGNAWMKRMVVETLPGCLVITVLAAMGGTMCYIFMRIFVMARGNAILNTEYAFWNE
jgi:hypothetical protein